MNQVIPLMVVAWLGCAATAGACTSVIVSAKASADGRPFFLKNRDNYDTDNVALLLQGERYRFVAIVGARDSQNVEAWGGHNEAGFALFNTSAYNLNGPDSQNEECDGRMMRRALEVCGSLRDFEHFLDTLPRPLRANSNFGALDAEGHAAYYEAGHRGYTKFDVDDPAAAPYGYLIRTNHAMSGDRALDRGVERYQAASDLLLGLSAAGPIDALQLLWQLPRHLKHGLTGIDLQTLAPADSTQRRLFAFRDFIPRYWSASTLLVQGVKAGESPLSTVSWTVVGSPLTTVALPLLIHPSAPLPRLVGRNADGVSPLCAAGQQLKRRLFPVRRGTTSDYIDIARLTNHAGTGILQQIAPIETELVSRGQPVVDAVRRGDRAAGKALADYYEWAENYVRAQYEERFGVIVK